MVESDRHCQTAPMNFIVHSVVTSSLKHLHIVVKGMSFFKPLTHAKTRSVVVGTSAGVPTGIIHRNYQIW